MAYATAEDLNLAFGRANVRKWADLEGNKSETDIAARIAWAIVNAEAVMDDRLRKSPAQFPLSGSVPASVTLHCAYLAGSMLYDSRGVTDFDGEGRPVNQCSWARKACEQFIRDVHARAVVLDVTPPIDCSESPFATPGDTTREGESTSGLLGWEEP